MAKDKDKGAPQSLDLMRKRIDVLDAEIQSLINERVSVAVDIARSKEAGGSQTFYRSEREARILKRVRERNEGPLCWL